MKPILITLTALALAVALLTAPWTAVDTRAAAPTSPGGTAAPALPAQSLFCGKTLSQWMERYWQWAMGGNQPVDHIGNVWFLPMPAENNHRDVTLKAGQAFVLPVIVWLRLEYPDGSVDPEMEPDQFSAVVTLDGRPLIDSENDSRYYFPLTKFNPPIPYYWDGVYVGDVIDVQGIGFVHAPLPVGVHTLTLHSELDDPWGGVYDNTWTITVKP
jgi:hypothetical protein